MKPQRRHCRKAASKYLREAHGVDRAPSTLAKYAVIGGGPVFQRMGRVPLYSEDDLDEWVSSKLSGPMRSTSDSAPFARETSGSRQQARLRGASDSVADEKPKPGRSGVA